MKQVTKFVCDVCGTVYSTDIMAQACEERHKMQMNDPELLKDGTVIGIHKGTIKDEDAGYQDYTAEIVGRFLWEGKVYYKLKSLYPCNFNGYEHAVHWRELPANEQADGVIYAQDTSYFHPLRTAEEHKQDLENIKKVVEKLGLDKKPDGVSVSIAYDMDSGKPLLNIECYD